MNLIFLPFDGVMTLTPAYFKSVYDGYTESDLKNPQKIEEARQRGLSTLVTSDIPQGNTLDPWPVSEHETLMAADAYPTFSPVAVKGLNALIRATNAMLIITDAMRTGRSVEHLDQMLRQEGVEPAGTSSLLVAGKIQVLNSVETGITTWAATFQSNNYRRLPGSPYVAAGRSLDNEGLSGAIILSTKPPSFTFQLKQHIMQVNPLIGLTIDESDLSTARRLMGRSFPYVSAH